MFIGDAIVFQTIFLACFLPNVEQFLSSSNCGIHYFYHNLEELIFCK